MAGRVAVVTGGTRGIGAAIARMLKDRGYKVAATYAGNDEAAQKFKKETGINAYKFDVGDFAACQTVIGQIEKDLGAVDVLINNAGITRDSTMRRLTRDMWDAVNQGWLEARVMDDRHFASALLPETLDWARTLSTRFLGAYETTMLRNEIYWFTRLGTFIERADNTARILDVKYHVLLPEEEHVGGPLDYYQWTSILRSVSALTAYHWVYRETLKPWLIADLLILNDTLPRSLASCYSNLVRNLDQIGVAYGRQGPSQRHARGIRNRLEHSNMDDIFQHGVHEFIQEFIADNSRLGEIITKQYLI